MALVLVLWCTLMVFQAATGPRDGIVATYDRQAGIETGVSALTVEDIDPEVAGRWLAVLLLVATLALVATQWQPVPDRRITAGFLVALALLTTLELPQLSNDLFLYRTTGELIADGANPYLVTPAGHFGDDALRGIPWTQQLTPYGPLAVACFGLLAGSDASLVREFWLFRAAMAAPWLILLAALWRRGVSPAALWMLGASPLLLLEVVQSGHLDGWLGILLVSVAALSSRTAPGTGSRALLAVAIIAAVSIKLSGLVVLGAVAVALSGHPAWGARRAAILGLACLIGCAAMWVPWWTGPEVLDGLRSESAKVLQSVFQVLHVPGRSASVLANAGSAAALVLGGWLVRRGWSLAPAMIAALIVHAVLGRTFLQPWYFVAPLMLAGWCVARGTRPAGAAGALIHPAFWAAASIGLIFGGYALVFATHSISQGIQTANVALMLIPALVAFVSISRRRA